MEKFKKITDQAKQFFEDSSSKAEEYLKDHKVILPSEGLSILKDSPIILDEINQNRWSKNVINWMNSFVFLSFITFGYVLLASYLAFARPIYEIKLPKSLKAEKEALYTKEKLNRDDLEYFVWNTLTIANHQSFKPNNMRPLLLGKMAPDIYERIQRSYEKRMETYKTNMLVQSLVISGLDRDIIINDKTGRVVLYAYGYYHFTTANPDQNLTVEPIVPYRALVTIDTSIISEANSDPFYISALTEKTGEAAKKWDAERKQESIEDKRKDAGL